MKVVNTVKLYSGSGVAKLKLLIKFNILADELSSFNADIMLMWLPRWTPLGPMEEELRRA